MDKTEAAPGERALFSWEIANNFPSADFWLINKSSEEKLGEPTKEFQDYLTGVRCPAIIMPSYGYYLLQYLHSQGYWQRFAVGSINWKHLRISDIRSVFNKVANSCREQKKRKIFTGEPLKLEFPI